MTRTTSIKHDLRQGLTVCGYQLKQCRTLLIVFAVLAAFSCTVIFSMMQVYWNDMFGNIKESLITVSLKEQVLNLFQTGAAAAIFLLTCVFTIIYTLRVFSYLHNKRKADRINPLPVKSGVLFIGKAMAAFAASVVPAIFFLWIVIVITLTYGVEVKPEVLQLLLKIPLGSIACISFYGLMAVCCGNSVNTVLSFLCICFCYPLSAHLIKGMIDSFFFGLPTDITRRHFLMKALNPMEAYDGVHIIYWLLFTVGCFALSAFLLRRRKSERAQTSFAFRLPCYLVEMLVTFIAGMLLGVSFASLQMLDAPFAGFVFGFILGGGTAFIIAHVILFMGFDRIVKSLIFGGAVSAAAIVFTAVCVFASPSYYNDIPDRESIVSAGYIDYEAQMAKIPKFSDVTKLARDSADDFADAADINSIVSHHQAIIHTIRERGVARQFRNVLGESLEDTFNAAFGYPSYKETIAYRLKDGSVFTRVYNTNYLTTSWWDIVSPYEANFDYYDYYTGSYKAITEKPAYQEKYNPVSGLTAQDVGYIQIISCKNGVDYTVYNDGESKEDVQKLFDAFQSDYLRLGYVESDDWFLFLNADTAESRPRGALLSLFSAGELIRTDVNQSYNIPESYTETRKVLKEIGIMTEKSKPNFKSKYVTSEMNPYANDDPL